MAGTGSKPKLDPKIIRDEDRKLIDGLAEFEAALDHLDCYAEVFASLEGSQRILDCLRRLESDLSSRNAWKEHLEMETISRISPELGEFARELKQEHEELRAGLRELSAAVEQLKTVDDLYEAISQIKEKGKRLAQQIGRHLALEESELASYA
jgi:hemerythrin HHE cation binding domain-containing protein